MIVKAWKGGGYGIRVGRPNALKFFPQSWPTIDVIINGITHTFKLSNTFWTTCPEFRGKVIKQWLGARHALSWSHGKPPAFTLSPLGGHRFRLR